MGNFYRVIYYWNNFNSDGSEFSDCSTHIHVMGPVFQEIPDDDTIYQLAAREDLLPDGKILQYRDGNPRSSLGIMRYAEVSTERHYNEDKVTFVGVIRVPSQGGIDPINGPELLPWKVLDKAIGYGGMGIADFGVDENYNNVLVMDGHEFEPLWKLHGYDIEDIEERLEFEIVGFYDENFRCDNCGVIISTTINTFVSNQKFVNECEQIGVSCGCYRDYCYENINEFLDNTEKAMDSDAIAKLLKEGKVVHHSDLCYGWSCSSSEPSAVLNSFYEFAAVGGVDIADEEDLDYDHRKEGVIFQVDSVGMFNTTYSLWIYRDRQNTEAELTKGLQECYEETTWLKDGGKVTVVNSDDARALFEEMYPDCTYEYTMYAIVILRDDGGINKDFAMSEPAGSAYNALRNDMIEMDIWENFHDATA